MYILNALWLTTKINIFAFVSFLLFMPIFFYIYICDKEVYSVFSYFCRPSFGEVLSVDTLRAYHFENVLFQAF